MNQITEGNLKNKYPRRKNIGKCEEYGRLKHKEIGEDGRTRNMEEDVNLIGSFVKNNNHNKH